MSLKPQTLCPVPEGTARIARAAFRKGNAYMKMRDELGVFYEDAQFADLFPQRGQPAEAPWRLALVTLFQFAENLTDRQAAEAVRSRIDWKYALSLELADEGFDYSVLSQFRDRLLTGGAEERLLEAMFACFTKRGLLKARGRQRTDSPHVLAAIRTVNRLGCVGEAMRHALNTLATVAPEWLRSQMLPDWPERYGSRFEEYRLPQAEEARKELSIQIGEDGFHLLSAVLDPPAPSWLRQVPAVDLLRRIWIQHYYKEDGTVSWREPADTPPAAVMIHSPYDPDARYSTKRTSTWTGYKVHLTETCDEEDPHVITHVETTEATTTDAAVVDKVHDDLADKERLPSEHLVDSGYVDAEHLVSSRNEHAVDLLGPVPVDGSWQAKAGRGFDQSCFVVDWSAPQGVCPEGKGSREGKATSDRHGKPVIHIAFDVQDCAGCARRALCTKSRTTGREMTLRPQEQYEALQAARQRQKTEAFQERHAARAGIEGTLSQGVRAFSLRRTRYIGLVKTHLGPIATAAAMNLARVIAWLTERPRETVRLSRFTRMAQAV